MILLSKNDLKPLGKMNVKNVDEMILWEMKQSLEEGSAW